MKISKGYVNKPVKLVIYGPEGIGKSTLAGQAPGALFADCEGGTFRLNVDRFHSAGWTELLSDVYEVAQKQLCRTLVLDTADWAEMMCIEQVCRTYNKKGIEDFGYGKGYSYVAEEFQKLIKAFDSCISMGINVIVLAHAKMRKFEQPDEMGAYDRWEMKLSKQTGPMLKEWADALLFLNYKTYVSTTDDGKKKASGGKRVMYASHHPCWDAKNRFGLPDEMDLSFANIAHIFPGTEDAASALERAGVIAKADPVLADVFSVTDANGNMHSYNAATRTITVVNPADGRTVTKGNVPIDKLAAAMKIDGLVKLYFKD